ncbi:MAG: serine/threonine protein kinase [Deltaproteobacteria bacterium]|nr:MAG: serine/threonine protein kinase [Deltaproteobacteria bacterium]
MPADPGRSVGPHGMSRVVGSRHLSSLRSGPGACPGNPRLSCACGSGRTMEPGQYIGRFEVQRTLGQGGIATVYQVRHPQLDTLHALKMLTINQRGLSRRLLQEGKIQAKLRHPNVVAVTDVVEHGDAIGLLMEYVEGSSLEACLHEGPMSVDEALGIFKQILAGVGAAHAAGVTHRDLKPANILLTTRGDEVIAKVLDFGIAKVIEDGQARGATRAGTTMGTPGYMAPEQISDATDTDHRADIFALGAILYEMLTGERAFQGQDMLEILNATVRGDHPRLEDRVPGIPEHICRAVDHALQVDRERRTPDCATMARELFGDDRFIARPEERGLGSLAAIQPVAGSPLPTLAPQPAPDRRNRTLVAASGTIAADLEDTVDDEAPTQPPRPAGLHNLAAAVDRAAAPPTAAPVPDRITWAGLVEGDDLDSDDDADDLEIQLDRRPATTTLSRYLGDPPDEEVRPDDPSHVVEGVSIEDASHEMGDLAGSLLSATVWAVARVLKHAAVPLLILAGFLAWSGHQADVLMADLDDQRHAAATNLSEAMDGVVAQVPRLVAAGGDASLLYAMRRRYEQADTLEGRVIAAQNLTSVMVEQLAQLPPPANAAEREMRHEVQRAITAIQAEATRYEQLAESYADVETSVGGRAARVGRIFR